MHQQQESHADMVLPNPTILDNFSPLDVYGKVTRIVGLVIEGTCDISSIGSLCEISPLHGGEPINAEIVGYTNNQAQFMPLGEIRGLGPGSLIRVKSQHASIHVGHNLLGRVIDGMGEPVDDGPPLHLQHQHVGHHAHLLTD